MYTSSYWHFELRKRCHRWFKIVLALFIYNYFFTTFVSLTSNMHLSITFQIKQGRRGSKAQRFEHAENAYFLQLNVCAGARALWAVWIWFSIRKHRTVKQNTRIHCSRTPKTLHCQIKRSNSRRKLCTVKQNA